MSFEHIQLLEGDKFTSKF